MLFRSSLTLDNGGLIHLAFAGILGVAAWSRGQEKLATIKAEDSSDTPPARGKAD